VGFASAGASSGLVGTTAGMAKGSSRLGLWVVKSSAPFSVMCMSSSRRMPKLPRR